MARTTAEFLFLTDDTQVDRATRMLFSFGIMDCEDITKEIGIYSRYPDSLQNTSVDDYLSIATNSLRAVCIHTTALLNFGCLDVNKKWNWNQFLFRFQGFWQHLKISSNSFIGPLGRLIWAAAIYLAAKEPITNEDNWSLSHLMVLTYQRSNVNSWICNLAVKYWRSKKTMTTSDIMAAYTGIKDHPIVQAWEPYN